MTSIQDLIAQREALDKQIADLRKDQRSDAIKQALTLISEYELTKQDLFSSTGKEKNVKAVGKKPAKYRDPVSQKTWTGQGATPKWISDSGKDKEAFLISV